MIKIHLNCTLNIQLGQSLTPNLVNKEPHVHMISPKYECTNKIGVHILQYV